MIFKKLFILQKLKEIFIKINKNLKILLENAKKRRNY